MKTGSFVFIKGVLKEEPWIPGRIVKEDGDRVKVIHYGPFNHFSKNDKFGTYIVSVPLDRLELRNPDLDDPMEFI